MRHFPVPADLDHIGPDRRLAAVDLQTFGLERIPDLGAFEAGTAPEPIVIPGKTIIGRGGADVLAGTVGDDTMKGKGGNDRIDGAAGNDKLRGGNGNDRLLGGDGDDVLKGGKGKDKLAGDLGDDVLAGGKHKDTFVFKGDFGEDRITDFKPGTDRIVFSKDEFADFAAVKDAMAACADGVMIDSGHGGVLVEDVKISDFGGKDFLFI